MVVDGWIWRGDVLRLGRSPAVKPKATNEPKSGFAHLRPASDCMARAVFVRSAVDDESRHARWEFSVGRSRAREAPTHCRHGSGLVSSGMIFSLTLGETPRVLASDARPRLARSLIPRPLER